MSSPRWTLTDREFEDILEESLRTLPELFHSRLENISIILEQEPSEEDVDLSGDDELLGIYRGVPLTERGHDRSGFLPDQIAIFRGPILRVCNSRRQAVREIRDTLIHELGHYFGLSDEEMEY